LKDKPRYIKRREYGMFWRRERAEAEDDEQKDLPPEEKPSGLKENRELGKISLTFHIGDESQVGRVALLLASTTSPEAEEECEDQIAAMGWRSVATEVGGLAGEVPHKLTRAVVGAALNGGVVSKSSGEMHALMHATAEAIGSFMAMSLLESSVGVKLAIVRNDGWLAVAVVGDAAYHAMAHHERSGLGIMHI
jgi:hut operon positive regulator